MRHSFISSNVKYSCQIKLKLRPTWVKGWKMNLFFSASLRLWRSFEEMVNSCLECLIVYYQFHVLTHTSVVPKYSLADVNKAIKYERPCDCLSQDIKSFNEKIAPP